MEKSKKELTVELEELISKRDVLNVLIAERSVCMIEAELDRERNISELQRLRSELKESQDRFYQISKLSKTVIWEVNVDGLYTYVSPVSEIVWGFTPEELIGKKHFYDLRPEENSRFYKEMELKLMSSQTNIVQFVNPVQRKNGTQIWVSTNGVPVFNPLNKMTGYRGSDLDITERKMAADEMRNFRLISDNAYYGNAIAALDGTISYVNKAFASLHGWEECELTGKNLSILYADKQKVHIDSLLEKLKIEGVVKTEEVWCVRKDGSVFPSIMNLMVISDQNDQPQFLSSTVLDISEFKQIVSENKKLMVAIEQSPIAIVSTDLNGTIQYVSPAFHAITGYNNDEVIGKNTRILKSGKTSAAVYAELWKTILAGKTWQGELINKKKDGTFYWESITIAPIHDEKGFITNYLAIKEDISDRKKTEHEIIELNIALERNIHERTSELADTNVSLRKEIDERKLIEGALHLKTAELENFFDVALDLLCVTDMSGNFIKVNKAWETILGLPAVDLQKRSFLEFVHPDDFQITLNTLVELKSQNPVNNFINRLKTNDGEYRFIEWQSVPVGQMIFAAARDINERKRAEGFEIELLHLSSQLTGIHQGEIGKALNLALGRIGNFLHADRAYIFEYSLSGLSMNNTYEWCNEGISAEIDNLQDLPYDVFPEGIKLLRKNENIIIPSVEDLPEDWKSEREILEPQGIQSLIIIPVHIENILIGFVGLDSVKRKRIYTKAEINIMRLWSSMIAGLLNNQRSANLLELTKQNYESFFNTIDDFLFVINHEGNIIHTNETVIDRLGYLDDEINNQSVMVMHPMERRDEAQLIIDEMLAGVTDFSYVPLMTKAGKQIPVETRVKRGYWNNEPVIFIVSKDISNIKLSEQKFSTAFQVNSAMMAITHYANGKHIDVNNSFLEVLGYSRDEIIGKNGNELDIYIDPNLRGRIIQKLNNNNPVRKMEMQMRTKEGDLKTGLLSADSIYIGQTHCLLTVTIDITDRKKAEDEIIMARHEADKANLAKSEFLSRMSHELRTPMNSILGFAQLLQMGDLNPKQAKGVNHIRQSGKHLLDLINEVLDIARIEAGRISLSIEAIPVKKVILELIDLVRPMANVRNLTIEVINTPYDDVFVKADHQRLKQVLINLLNNAIKYNIESGIIRIRTEMFSADDGVDGRVRILISDTGLGIKPEDLTKLFKPFERIGAENTATEGTGLGLAVVEKLMTAMGGFIGVDSEIGKGSTFWIEFPHIINKKSPDGEDYQILEQESESADKKGQILYIEDDSSNIYLVEQVLAERRPNINLITAMTGKQALKMALQYAPDLILLDLNLPDVQGETVLAQLQENENTRSIPVVIVTADAMPHKFNKLIQSGAKNYLTKPFEVVNFLEVVDQFMIG
jgi:PAS domain S-box-containing protein